MHAMIQSPNLLQLTCLSCCHGRHAVYFVTSREAVHSVIRSKYSGLLRRAMRYCLVEEHAASVFSVTELLTD